MSFLSALGKIGKAALNIGTGGIAGTIMDAAGDMGSVLGKQQEGKAQGQMNQATLQQRQDQLALDRYRSMQDAEDHAGQLDLDRQKFEGSNRSSTAKQALIGALLSGGIGKDGIVGGLNNSPDAKAAMAMLGQQGAGAQASPMAFAGGKQMVAPTLTALPQIDKGGFLSTLASIGQIAGAASPYIKNIGKRNDADQEGLF